MTWLFQIEIYFPVTSKFRLTFNKNAESLALQAAQLSSLHHTYRFTHTRLRCASSEIGVPSQGIGA